MLNKSEIVGMHSSFLNWGKILNNSPLKIILTKGIICCLRVAIMNGLWVWWGFSVSFVVIMRFYLLYSVMVVHYWWWSDIKLTFYSSGVPGDSDSKESAYNAGDLGSIPGLGRSPGGGHDISEKSILFVT